MTVYIHTIIQAAITEHIRVLLKLYAYVREFLGSNLCRFTAFTA
jgi:hypothetical protein